MTIGTNFDVWFEEQLKNMTPEALALYNKQRLQLEREQVNIWRERALVWKKLAKSLRSDLLAANEELDEADNMNTWFT